MLRRIMLAVTAGMAWTKARDFVLKDDPKSALSVIEALPTELQTQLRWRLLRLQQLFLLKRDTEVAQESVGLLRLIALEKSLNDDEAKYLHAYVTWLVDQGYRETVGRPPLSQSVDSFDLGKIRLDRVDGTWKRAFSLRVHPDWSQ